MTVSEYSKINLSLSLSALNQNPQPHFVTFEARQRSFQKSNKDFDLLFFKTNNK